MSTRCGPKSFCRDGGCRLFHWNLSLSAGRQAVEMGTDRSLNVWRSRYVRCEERMLVATSLYHLDLSENLGRSIVAARRPPRPQLLLFLTYHNVPAVVVFSSCRWGCWGRGAQRAYESWAILLHVEFLWFFFFSTGASHQLGQDFSEQLCNLSLFLLNSFHFSHHFLVSKQQCRQVFPLRQCSPSNTAWHPLCRDATHPSFKTFSCSPTAPLLGLLSFCETSILRLSLCTWRRGWV